MKKKMLGLFLASLFALSLAGVAYAYWSETFVLEGTVEMGTFWGEMTLDSYWDWDDYLVVYGKSKDVADICAFLGDEELEADGSLYSKSLTILIGGPLDEKYCIPGPGGAYPGYTAWVIWDMHWWGTVPAHVEASIPPELPPWMVISVEVLSSTVVGIDVGEYSLAEFNAIMEESQWHYCNEIVVEMEFYVLEDDYLGILPEPGDDCEFTLEYLFYQYNLDGYEGIILPEDG